MTNNLLVHEFERAAITPTTVKLMLRTDANPEETTWEIVNSSGVVVSSGGPYANAGTIYQETMEVDDMECYKFLIYDSGGDGLIMPGFFAFYHGSNNYILTGTTFGSVDSAFFEANTTVGFTELPVEQAVSLYPNPAREKVMINFTPTGPADVNVRLFDLTGSRVMEKSYGTVMPGDKLIELDTRTLSPGMYFVTIQAGTESTTRRLTIIR